MSPPLHQETAAQFLSPLPRFIPEKPQFTPELFAPRPDWANPLGDSSQIMQLRKQSMLTVLAVGLLIPMASFASGSYSARPPRISVSGGEKIDSAKYELGKRIYTGKAKLDTGTAPNGEARLRALDSALPEKERKKINLAALNGKLNAEQLDALEYYVAHRFPKK